VVGVVRGLRGKGADAAGQVAAEALDRDGLDALVASRARPVSVATVTRDEALGTPAYASCFGGLPYAEAGDAWPMCPGCGGELTFVCQFRLDETVLADLNDVDLMVHFVCIECGMDGEEHSDTRLYRGACTDRIERIEPRSGDALLVPTCRVSFEHRSSYPHYEDVDPELARAIEASSTGQRSDPYAEALGRVDPRFDPDALSPTMVGGYPQWIQGSWVYTCPHDGRPLELLAQIGSEDEADLMWGDSGSQYLLWCPEHPDSIEFSETCY